MEPLSQRVGNLRGGAAARCLLQRGLLPWLILLAVLVGFDPAWGVKRHNLLPVESSSEEWGAGGLLSTMQASAGQTGQTMHTAATETQHVAPQATPAAPHSVTPPAKLPAEKPAAPHAPGAESKLPGTVQEKPSRPAPGPDMPGIQRHEIVPTKAAASSEPEVTIAHDEAHVVLPKLSPIPGVTFVATMISLLEEELHGRTFGWRPNDVILGRFTDNVNNYQLGVLEAMRFTTMRLKDSLTRMGDADTYDPDLESALNLLMNRASLFWFPSAETSYGEAVEHLNKFLVKLETRERHFYYRTDNLQLLVSSYKDLLGNVNRNLIRTPIGLFKSDDYFYYAKGVAHVYYEILKVVRVGFYSQLASTLDAVDIMDEILHELHRAEQMDPWLVLDSSPNSLFANHRANLNAPLSEVVHLLGVLAQF